ncbi:conserved hypothetical protein [uncultured Desulfobacterium sp.]|uniref:Radical SAM core domain-containing protein n=1 Tax=uncultured Desulfobacterium sp. TaxID=201089 RepID=A0A445MRT4_9BACT|nr:conserved hypothetical protein [uncultured Desulfobacterium sp.]
MKRGGHPPFSFYTWNDSRMQLSRYLKVYPWQNDRDLLLLYSTRQASKILIKSEIYHLAEKGMLSPTDESLLAELGMVVPDRLEEQKSMMGIMDDLNSKNKILNITLILNLECNFACRYCFEGDIKGKYYLSDDTADHLINFISERFTGTKKKLLIDFYGGEPLLSIRCIKKLSKTLKSLVEARGGSYGFTLVTNGSLFSRKVAESLAALGLETVKITLDGPAYIHNINRPLKSGAESFDTIIRNIKETWDTTRIQLGGNYETDNYKHFVLLLDYLIAEGITPDKISAIKFDPVSKYPEKYASEYMGGCMSLDEPWLIPASAMLREEILKRGYNTPAQRLSTCVVESSDSYVINFDGTIYKCPGFVGKAGFDIGGIKNGLKKQPSPYKPGMWKNDECISCSYLPLCFGGCRYMAFVRDGEINALDCQKSFLDAILETMIKQEIKYHVSAEGH